MSRRACCWSRKKTPPRPRRLVFGGGDATARPAPARAGQACPDCPARLNRRARSRAGRSGTWPGGSAASSACARRGARLGHERGAGHGRRAGRAARAAAELLPVIEAVMARQAQRTDGWLAWPHERETRQRPPRGRGGRQVKAELEGVGEAGKRGFGRLSAARWRRRTPGSRPSRARAGGDGRSRGGARRRPRR
jgi:hypothetical protein